MRLDNEKPDYDSIEDRRGQGQHRARGAARQMQWRLLRIDTAPARLVEPADRHDRTGRQGQHRGLQRRLGR